MATTTKYPIDVTTLKKGDVISADVIEHIYGVKRDDVKKFALAKVTLRQFILDNLDVSVKVEGDTIRVLTDEEAAEYENNRLHCNLRKAERNLNRQAYVNVDNLSDVSKKIHERRLDKNGRIIRAMQNARKMPALQPSVRSVPGLPKAKGDE